MTRCAAILCLSGLLLVPVGCSTPTATTEPTAATEPTDPETGPATSEARPKREPIEPSAEAQAVVDANDRPESDRRIDERRRAAEMLTFMQVRPGMKVADLMAGGGYTTELLARTVGPSGVVYAQNNAFALENIVKGGLDKRLQREVVANVVAVAAELEAPLPEAATGLDLVTIVFSYHDAIALGTDVAALNKAVFEALAPGGRFIVIDHAAPDGTPLSKAEALHRLDEAMVVQQVTEAGFRPGRTSDFLRDPADARTAPSFKVGFETDRFALEFIKPQS
ncbi:MAG: class I SAM-dependent methyltransferase [Deltaproteobacteria bacterium]|nr:class I SAM-dependent methyltransferase [Deltaproteobacteria bacterium]